MKTVKVSYNSLIKAAVVAGHMPCLQSLSTPVALFAIIHFETSTYFTMLQQLPLLHKYLQAAKVSRVMRFAGLKEVQSFLCPWSIRSIDLPGKEANQVDQNMGMIWNENVY